MISLLGCQKDTTNPVATPAITPDNIITDHDSSSKAEDRACDYGCVCRMEMRVSNFIPGGGHYVAIYDHCYNLIPEAELLAWFVPCGGINPGFRPFYSFKGKCFTVTLSQVYNNLCEIQETGGVSIQVRSKDNPLCVRQKTLTMENPSVTYCLDDNCCLTEVQ
jgi:hypothetical protein